MKSIIVLGRMCINTRKNMANGDAVGFCDSRSPIIVSDSTPSYKTLSSTLEFRLNIG